jgi:phosphoglycolate phosphatase
MIGGGVGVLLERGLGDGDPALIERAKKKFKDAYRRHLLATTRCYEGVLELVESLERIGVTTSIATNKPSWFTNPLVEHLRIPVRAVASADEAPRRKPDPAVVALAIERTGRAIDRSSTIYVGDMPIDLETARAFGVPLIGVSWGFDPSALRRLVPDHFIDHPRELIAVIRPH